MGPQRDGVWRESGIIREMPADGLKEVWRQPIGIGYTGPSVQGQHVYVMDWQPAEKPEGGEAANAASSRGQTPNSATDDSTRGSQPEGPPQEEDAEQQERQPAPKIPGIPGTERVLCLSLETGETVWEHAYECNYQISYPNGPRATPIVSGDKLFSLGAMGDLICFDRADGTVVWSKKLTESYETKPPFWGYAAHPLIVGERIYLTVGGAGSAIVCLNKADGAEIWKSRTSSDVGYVPLVLFQAENDSGARQGPTQLLCWHRDGVDSVNPDTGASNWFVKFPEEPQQEQATCIAMPRISGNQVFITEFFGGSLLLELSETASEVTEVYRSTREQLRAQEAMNTLLMTPFVKDGLVFGCGTSNGRGESELKCVELSSGDQLWGTADPLGEGNLLFASCFLVENEGLFFIPNDSGELILARLDGEGYHEIGRTPMLEPTHRARGRVVVWSHPAFAQGMIIARNDKEIVCYDLRAASYK